MKRSKLIIPVLLAIAALLVNPAANVRAATAIEIDDEEYNLYVDEYPDSISEGIYAKFKSSKSNYDDYYLNLSSDESDDIFTAALDKSNINYSGDRLFCSMTAALYKSGDEEDKKVTDTVIVLLPVPDDSQEHPEDATLYMVSGSSAKPVSSTLVVCDDVYYNQFTLSSYTTYGYVYLDPYSYDEEDDDEEEDDDSYEDEDEEDYEDEEPTAAPTKKPAATPTPKVTSAPNSNTTTVKTPTAGPVRDNVPKTGDDFSYTPLAAGIAVSVLALAYCIRKLSGRK